MVQVSTVILTVDEVKDRCHYATRESGQVRQSSRVISTDHHLAQSRQVVADEAQERTSEQSAVGRAAGGASFSDLGSPSANPLNGRAKKNPHLGRDSTIAPQ